MREWLAACAAVVAVGCAQGAPVGRDAGRQCSEGQELCGSDCAILAEDTRHCGACGVACADGERCDDGTCVFACPGTQTACEIDGAVLCISTASDPANCGACGVACGAGEVCSEGACGTSCAPGLTACTLPDASVACADTALDAAHCGGCNMPCAPSEDCVGGDCELVCPAGQTACGGLCVNLMTDDMSCGACGVACTTTEDCVGGTCTTVCPTGTMDCGGICRDLASDTGHCGGCDMACASGEICSMGRCTLSCPSGQTACAGACVATATDPSHCGACGTRCPAPVGGTASCTGGRCASSCPMGQTDCAGTCRDLASDSANCGACGRTCPTGQACTAASCVPALPPIGGPTFRIDSLGASSCTTLDHDALTGDDRGGLAVSTSQVFVSGDDATARFSRTDLSGGVALDGRIDVMVGNLRNGNLYALADAGGALDTGGGTVTRLLRLSSISGQPQGSGDVLLSTPIAVTGSDFGSNVGLFAGWDRVVIHNGVRVYSIDLVSGAVTDLGAMTIPARRACENWAYWGIAETDGTSTNLIFVENSTTIRKVRVPTGASLATFAFTNLSDMCSISAVPSLSRWYFHHEFTSQFTSTGSEVIGYCTATFDTTAPNFRVLTMTGTGCATYDHGAQTGDDRGGIAVSSSYVFYTGDTATGRFSRSAFPPAVADRVGLIHEGMISNLRTGQVYALGNGGRALPRGGGQVTELVELSATSGAVTSTRVTLSSPIDVASTTTGAVGLFSGYDRVVIHNGTRVFHVSLPSGVVTDLGAMGVPTARRTCENWAYWGVAELFGGQLWIAYANTANAIERARVPDGMTQTVAPFTSLADMCSFTIVPALNRWYWHHEGTSQFTSMGLENVGFCEASWSSP